MATTLTQILNRLDDVPDGINSQIKSYESNLIDEILDLIEQLRRDASGVILSDVNNLRLIDSISGSLKNFMFNGEYAEIIQGFAGEFNVQRELNNKYFTDLFDDFAPNDLYAEASRIARTKQLSLFGAGAVEQVFIVPLNEKLESAITGKMSFRDLRKSLIEYVKGQEQLEGRLTRYVKQQAKDAFSIYDRTYSQTVSSDLDIQFYKYLGGLIKDSRCFCIDRAEKYYHAKEIEAFGNKQNLGTCAESSQGIARWQGMYRGTDGKTIFIYAGGYNCNHKWAAVSEISVPKEVLLRNIKNGNYSPDKKTRSLLKI